MRAGLNRFVKALLQSRYGVVTQQIDDPNAALTYAHWSDKRPLRLLVPVEMLRMQGGFAYGPDHPFVAALGQGQQVLEQFYERFAPTTLSQMYAPDMADETGADLPQWELPWRLRLNPKAPLGEKGLGAKHGVAFYGPCSAQKIQLEMQRLQNADASIRKNGFDPDRHGDIEGQLLSDGTRTIFFVAGGKHRAAVLTHQGHRHIPVRLRPSLMRLVDQRLISLWPAVQDGRLGLPLAGAIMDCYLRGRAGTSL